MARPRIFVSSTFYDLRQVRADLERFIRDLGFEPVLHEKGSVPYGPDERLEAYCYREISNCDILVSIVGSRFGTASGQNDYSISQTELRKAIELQRPIYMFVEHGVLSEFRTYQANKDNKKICYASVDDIRVFRFIDEVKSLPQNNAMFSFAVVSDITEILREQWAGHFRNLLHESSKTQEINLSRELKSSISTLRQMIDYIAKEQSRQDDVIRTIVTQNHPLFTQIADMTNAPYRVFFTNNEEMERWLKARGWVRQQDEEELGSSYLCWLKDLDKKTNRKLSINKDVFQEDGRLRHFDHSEWQSDWVSFHDTKMGSFDDLDDEIPF